MICPECKQDNYCGCKSCKKRKGMYRKRSERLNKDDWTCGYCRTTFNAYLVEEWSYIGLDNKQN